MKSPCFKASQGHVCDPPSCNKDHIDLSITVWKNGDGETTEAFCLNSWTPDQFDNLRTFIKKQNNDALLASGLLLGSVADKERVCDTLRSGEAGLTEAISVGEGVAIAKPRPHKVHSSNTAL